MHSRLLQSLRLRRYCKPLLTAALAVMTCLAPLVHAETVNFDASTDLAAFSLAGSSGNPLQWGGFGVGSPAGGGLRFVPASASKTTSVASKQVSTSASTTGQWQMSVLVNAGDVLAASGTENKVEVSFGYAVSNTAVSSWEKYLTESVNYSIGAMLKVEKKNTKVEIGMYNNASGSKVDLGKQSWNAPSFALNQWLRVTIYASRSGVDTFNTWYTLEGLGTTGLDTPVTLHTSGITSAANPNFDSAQNAYAALVISTDKAISTIYADSLATELSTPNPPAIPVAVEPTVIAPTSFTASWANGAGLPPTAYVLEISTQVDNFAANKFIAANGATGQSAGISVGPTQSTQVISGLQPGTSYVYRVRGTNTAGSSAPSNLITVTTLAMGANSPPTLNELADFGPISSVTPAQVIALSGISPGAESGQSVTVTASSSNPAVIAHPVVSYTNPAATGTITLSPGGQEGTATISVTVNDGQSQDNTVTRAFSVTVSNPPENLSFESETDIPLLNTLTAPTLSFSRGPAAGAGDPPGGGLVVTSSSTSASDAGFVGWRAQSYPLAGITSLETSMLVNMRELDDFTTGEGKSEFRVGFTPTLAYNSSKLHEFLHKTNKAISVNIKAEHKPSDSGKLRVIETEMFLNGDEMKAGKQGLANTDAINNWLKVTFKVIPMGGGMFGASYKIEDLGEFGTDVPAAPLLQSEMFTFSAPTLAASPIVYAAYAGKIEKQLTHLYLDDHRVVLSNLAPDAPTALAASLVTSNKFTARWQPGVAVFPTGYLLEVVQGVATPFTAGNFIGANGATGQATGIVIGSGTTLKQALTGLLPGTTYRYQIIGTNINGSSPASSPVVSVTTLAAGQNAVPTLDEIVTPPPLAMNAGQQFVTLTGITDGGEDGQPVTVTAVSGNTTVIPQESVSFAYLEGSTTSGVLSFTPAPGQIGTVNIAVTVSDGQATNSSVTRNLVVKVVNPPAMLEFPSATELEELIVTQANLNLTYEATGGVGTPGTGGLLFSGGTTGTDRDVVVVRPTAYNAQQASYFYTSMMVNFAEVLNAPAGSKDKGELRLGFMNSSTVYSAKPKETMHKANPSLGVKFKVEHDTSESDKDRKLEIELFAYDGGSELKGGKIELHGVASAGNWFNVRLYAVRSGTGAYYLTAMVDDYGADGTEFVGSTAEIPPTAFVNPAFATDSTVFSAFVLGGEKAGTGSLRADRFEAIVNTTAPDAPATQVATDITHESFTANWSAAVTGHQDLAGFIVEICDPEDKFLPGTFYSADGLPNRSSGIYVEDPYAISLPITGLQGNKQYLYRVRSVRTGGESGPSLNSVLTVTEFAPGISYDEWMLATFGPEVPSGLKGQSADADGDGVPNLIEYALGLTHGANDAANVPHAEVVDEHLTLVFKQRYLVGSLLYQPLISENLSSWSMDGLIIDIFPPGTDGMQTVVVQDAEPISASDRKFIKLSVTGPDDEPLP
ncbi:fibronectin type III domain-containing protein [Verrucomicrobium sp. BvORR106]|uniref:fibronectin type III domain-containing protein n=1 Tax=Verrucomicrobium sp. BvORR106 TaxID=1403819 RepID=UPI000AFF301F|nr:fibronectin type III domain-containing protein [Verrucomicrobium sp. BvORR106]